MLQFFEEFIDDSMLLHFHVVYEGRQLATQANPTQIYVVFPPPPPPPQAACIAIQLFSPYRNRIKLNIGKKLAIQIH